MGRCVASAHVDVRCNEKGALSQLQEPLDPALLQLTLAKQPVLWNMKGTFDVQRDSFAQADLVQGTIGRRFSWEF